MEGIAYPKTITSVEQVAIYSILASRCWVSVCVFWEFGVWSSELSEAKEDQEDGEAVST